MANRAWREVRARCPYYLRSNAYTITCQTAEEGREIRFKFPNPTKCADAFNQGCAMNYTKCLIYRLIDQILEHAE